MRNLITIAPQIIFVLFYYNYGKKIFILAAEKITKKGLIQANFALKELKGVIELILIVLSHMLFLFLIATYSRIPLSSIFTSSHFHWSSVPLGIALGIGQVALSSTIGLILIKIIEHIAPEKAPRSIEGWIVQSRSGWIKHHYDILERFPLLIAASVIVLQITCEESVFRGVLLNSFLPISPTFAILFSTFLFVSIQAFLMPSKLSSMFPIIGAIIIGLSNGYLYYNSPNIYPMIVSHAVFFFFSFILN